jgi:AcrR family transcriptional regulator
MKPSIPLGYPRCTRPMPERFSLMPPGSGLEPRDLMARHQRERIIAAMTELAAKRGYQSTTIEHIGKTARVALSTFYEHFESKEQCFLAALDEAMAEVRERLGAAVDPGQPWAEQICAGLKALLDIASDEPALARICLVEAQGAGPVALRRYEAGLAAAAPKLRQGREAARLETKLPEALEDATIGGLAWLNHDRLVMNQVERIRPLLPEAIELVLAPYLGELEARRLAAEAVAAPGAAG